MHVYLGDLSVMNNFFYAVKAGVAGSKRKTTCLIQLKGDDRPSGIIKQRNLQ